MPDQRNMLDQTKMTAPIPAVGAAGEQSQNNKTNDIIPKDRKNNNSLHTLSMTELYDTTYPPKAAIIDGLLYAGAYLFVGAPKIGKSWLALWLAVMVAKGNPVWGMGVKQGTTLYLCLEDSTLRIQNRLFEITEDAPPASTSPPTATLSARAWRNSSARCLDKGNPRLCRGRKRAYSEGRSRQEKVSKLE